MKSQDTKAKVIYSLMWKFFERGGTQGIQLVVQILLARLLLPEDYGVIAVVTTFIVIANVFVQSGLNTALVQKKDADEVDFSSIFYLSLFIAGVLYIILFFSSPFIADFFRMQELKLVLRVLSLKLFFGAFNSIQNAYVAKHMMFKKLFFSSLGAIVLSGAAGVVTAFLGWGVWALVAQQLVSQISITLILWFTVKWRPLLVFSFKKVKVLFSYGSKLLASSLIDHIYKEIRTLIIGRIFTKDVLGIYSKGQQYPRILAININDSIQAVMLPALSLHQDNKPKVKSMVRRSIVTSSFIMFPAMIGLAAVAEPMVKVLLTEKWLPSVPFLRIFCMTYALWPIHTANLQAINSLGRSDIFLKLEIVKKIIGVSILIVSIRYGVFYMALGVLLSGIISSFVNAYPNKKLLNYSYFEQCKDLLPSLIIASIMGGSVYAISFLNLETILILLLQIVAGVIIYVGMSKIFKIEAYEYLVKTAKDLLKKRTEATN